MPWIVIPDISGNDSVGQQEAADWGIDADFVPSIENTAWYIPTSILNFENIVLEPLFYWSIVDESQF